MKVIPTDNLIVIGAKLWFNLVYNFPIQHTFIQNFALGWVNLSIFLYLDLSFGPNDDH